MKSKYKIFFSINDKENLVSTILGVYANQKLKFDFIMNMQLFYLLLDKEHKCNNPLFKVLWDNFTMEQVNLIYLIREPLIFNLVGRKSKCEKLNLIGLKKFFLECKLRFSVCLTNYKSFLDSLKINMFNNSIIVDESDLMPFQLYLYLQTYIMLFHLAEASRILKQYNIMYILQLSCTSENKALSKWYCGQNYHLILSSRFKNHPFFHNPDFIKIWGAFRIIESSTHSATNSSIALEDSLFSALSSVLKKHKLIVSNHLGGFSVLATEQTMSFALNLVFLDSRVIWNKTVVPLSIDALNLINQDNYNKI